MARRRHRSRPWREVPRPCQAQRDRPGVLDDLPGDRVRAGREFGFEVLVGDRPVNNWHYRLAPVDGGTDVTESFRMNDGLFTTLFWSLAVSSDTAQHPRHAQDAGADQGRRRGARGCVTAGYLNADAEDRDPEAEQPDPPLADRRSTPGSRRSPSS